MTGTLSQGAPDPLNPVTVANMVDDEVEILCDSGAGNLPFLRRYDFSAGSPPVITNTTLDGVTPYVPVGPVARCSATAITNQFDDEYQILCDSTPTTFLRRLRTDSAGVVTVANFTLAGGAFVPVGAVSSCSVTVGNFRDDEYVQLCDSTPTPFLRRFRTDAAGAVTTSDLTLAGGAFVPVGAVGLCATAVNNRRDLFAQVLCDTVGSFLRRFTMNDAGVVTATNTTLDGVTAYVPVGAVGVCGLTVSNRRDTTTEVLCDNNGAFLRRYTINDAGVVTIINTLLDGTTAYVPVGTVKTCSPASNASTLTWSTINAGSGVVAVGLNSEGWTATLNVASGVTVGAGDTGTIGGQTVPVGYSVGVDADPGQLITTATNLSAAGVAFWTVLVRG